MAEGDSIVQQPNILYLHAHNTGRIVQPYGYNVPAPHLQRLAQEGVLFRQGFAGSPTCSPSRARLLTGQCSHTNGMIGLAHRGFRLHDYSRTMIQTLGRAGYLTVLGGMQHIARDRAILGYQLDFAPDLPWPFQPPHVLPSVLRFLESSPSQPFFLDVGLNEAHREYYGPGPKEDPRYVQPAPWLPDLPEIRRDVAGYMATVRVMDDAFGQVLAALERSMLADNTLVICLADHGLQSPGGMCNLTDAGLETFWVMRGPGGFSGGKVVDAMTSHTDIFPTVCELAGIPIPSWVEGKSMLPLVRGQVGHIHEEIIGEINYHAAYEPQRCVRTPRWKYIKRYDSRPRPNLPNIDRSPTRDVLEGYGLREQVVKPEALFDLIFDPHEMNNRVDDPALAEVLADMRNRLDRGMRQTHDPLLQGKIDAPVGSQA